MGKVDRPSICQHSPEGSKGRALVAQCWIKELCVGKWGEERDGMKTLLPPWSIHRDSKGLVYSRCPRPIRGWV